MKRFNFVKALLSIALLGVIAFGCNENDPVEPSSNSLAAPASISVAMVTETAVKLSWPASTAASDASFQGYTITYGTSGKFEVTGNLTEATVIGLTTGTEYTFTINTKKTDGTLSTNGPSVKVSTIIISPVFKLYGSSSSQPSGASLTNGNPQLFTTANGGKWDIAFDTQGGYFIGSPYQTDYVETGTRKFKTAPDQIAKKTIVGPPSSVTLNVTDLTALFATSPLSIGTEENLQQFNKVSNSIAFPIITAEGNYARVMVISTSGQLVQTDANGEYIQVQVAFQRTAGVPFAKH